MAPKEEADKKEAEKCPSIADITENVQELSYEDKLKLIEEEATTLYEFCVGKGFHEKQLYKCVSNFRGGDQIGVKKVLKDSSRSMVKLGILMAVIAVVFANPSAYNMFTVHGKLFSMKYVLPYWDWTYIYNEDCLIPNVYLDNQEKNITKEDCQFCLDLKGKVERVYDLKPEEANRDFIQASAPVLVTDIMKNWNEKKELNKDAIVDLYRNNEFLRNTMGSCQFETNSGFDSTFYSFTDALAENKLPPTWHMIWQNCDVRGAKVVRHYYARPYYLPPMVQAEPFNIIIMAEGKHDGDWISFPSEGQSAGFWVTVIEGELTLRISPESQCYKYKCRDIDVTVREGEHVFHPLFGDWLSMYKPSSTGMTLAVAAYLIWDDQRIQDEG